MKEINSLSRCPGDQDSVSRRATANHRQQEHRHQRRRGRAGASFPGSADGAKVRAVRTKKRDASNETGLAASVLCSISRSPPPREFSPLCVPHARHPFHYTQTPTLTFTAAVSSGLLSTLREDKGEL